MVTEDMLHNAALEAEQSLLQTLSEEAQSHQFSEKFEKKIKKLTRRAKHPVGYRVLRYAAVVVLVMATMFGTVLAVSPEARASILGWFLAEPVGPYTHYVNADAQGLPDAATEMKYDYYLPTLPEGYSLMLETPRVEGKTYLYSGNTGMMLYFNYHYAVGAGELFLDVEGYQHERVTAGGVTADLYTTTEERECNVIIWNSKHSGVMFQISADLEKDELIALAESVQHREFPKENET